MVSKKELINNLREYSADEVVDVINAGVVTLYELSKSGNMTPLMRERIEKKLAQSQTQIAEQDSVSPIEEMDHISQQSQKEEDKEAGEEIFFLPSSDSIYKSQDEEGQNIDDEPAQKLRRMFAHPFSFKGRIRRLEYGISYIIYLVWYMIFQALAVFADTSQQDDGYTILGVFLILTVLPISWFVIAQGCKRCHDRDSSGWWQLIPFYWFVMLFGDSEPGSNEYGDNPKGK